jgi:hypothetical protein
MTHLAMTRHARQRLQQRGAQAKEVEIVATYADIEVPAGDGCRFLRLSEREAAWLLRDGSLPTKDVDRARRIMVLVNPTGEVVTILKCEPTRRFPGGRRGYRR